VGVNPWTILKRSRRANPDSSDLPAGELTSGMILTGAATSFGCKSGACNRRDRHPYQDRLQFHIGPAPWATAVQEIVVMTIRGRRAVCGVAVVVVALAATQARASGAPTSPATRPVISAMSTHSSRLVGGARLTISGRNFARGASVTVGGKRVSDVRRISATLIRVSIPAHRAGVTSVRVRDAGRRSVRTRRSRLVYVAPPEITAVAPSAVVADDPKTVTISGRNFRDISEVRFISVEGYEEVDTVHVLSSHLLKVAAPDQDGGTVTVRVRGRFGTSPPVRAARLTYVAAPAITTPYLPDGSTTRNYHDALSTRDGGPGTWAITDGSLPSGLHLSNGVIAGRPTSVGITPLTVRFTDRLGQRTNRSYTLSVTDGHWSASSVDALPPDASPGNGNLYGVDCPSTTMCAAVGTYLATDHTTRGLLATWINGAWSTTSMVVDGTPAYPNRSIQTRPISCSAPGSCVAIAENSDESVVVIATLTNGTWTEQTAPVLPGDDINRLRAISCSDTQTCVAVGDHGYGAFIETLADGTWHVSAPPASAGTEPLLLDVDCAQPTTCVAVGSYLDTSLQRTEPLILTLADGTWQQQTAPAPSNVIAQYPSDTALHAVSCPTTTACTAVGEYNAQSLVQTQTTDGWSASSPPAGQLAALTTLSCSTDTCLVAGYRRSAPNGPVAATIHDRTWSPISLPSETWEIRSASCTGGGLCAFTGSAHDTADGTTFGILGALTSTSTTVQRVAVPSDAVTHNPTVTVSAPFGISCPAHTSCVAVGGYQRGPTTTGALTDTYTP
jgi:hypothetical protein